MDQDDLDFAACRAWAAAVVEYQRRAYAGLCGDEPVPFETGWRGPDLTCFAQQAAKIIATRCCGVDTDAGIFTVRPSRSM